MQADTQFTDLKVGWIYAEALATNFKSITKDLGSIHNGGLLWLKVEMV